MPTQALLLTSSKTVLNEQGLVFKQPFKPFQLLTSKATPQMSFRTPLPHVSGRTWGLTLNGSTTQCLFGRGLFSHSFYLHKRGESGPSSFLCYPFPFSPLFSFFASPFRVPVTHSRTQRTMMGTIATERERRLANGPTTWGGCFSCQLGHWLFWFPSCSFKTPKMMVSEGCTWSHPDGRCAACQPEQSTA